MTKRVSVPVLRLRVAALLAGTCLGATGAQAADGTWLAAPGTNEWTTGTNWSSSPAVPDGTATFGASSTTSLNISNSMSIGTIQFDAGAPAYSFEIGPAGVVDVNIVGAGIVNKSASAPSFVNGLGRLNFSNASTAGNANIDNFLSVTFNDSATAGSAFLTNRNRVFFRGTSTAGSATINNIGVVVEFHDSSSAGNATIVNRNPNPQLGGQVRLEFFDNSTAGSATITNDRSGALILFHDTSNAGTATITNTNSAQLKFAGSSKAGSATIIGTSGSVIEFLESSSAANATITSSFGSINFFDLSKAGNATINNTFSPVGFFNSSSAENATINANGSVLFSDTSSAGDATINANGQVVFQASGSAGRANLRLLNGFGIFLNNSTAANATITVTSNGAVTFFDSSTADNATIVNDGATRFIDTSSAGHATITTNSGGTLQFAQSATGGLARLITNSGGSVDISELSGAGLTVGSIEGAGAYFLGSKRLTVGGNNLSTEVAGVIQDGGVNGGTGGSLVKTGSGTLTLSGINTYAGATVVDAGTLVVNGSIASSVLTTVNSGGTLAGTGTVGSVLVTSGGIFAPGPSATPGTMTVAGNLAFESGGIYLVQVDSAGASRADVSGTATLTGGNVQAVFAPGSSLTRQQMILHTGGLGGTEFSGVTTNLPGFAVSLSYTPTDVLLNLTAGLGLGGRLSQNQQNVADSLNSYFNNGGALPPNFVAIFGLTGGNLGNTLTQLSGEPATGAQQGAFQLTGQFLGAMLDPFVDGRSRGANGPALGFAPDREKLPDDVALAYAKVMKAPVATTPPAFEQRWNVWGSAYGGYSRTSGDPAGVGSHDVTARTGGFAAGLDYRVTADTVVGLALAGGGTNWALADGLGGGESDAFQAGVYGATRAGPAYLAAALAFSNHWMSTDRFAAFGDHLTASFKAQSIGGRVETGYRYAAPIGGVAPYAALQVQSFQTPTYRETDLTAGGFGLTYNARTASDTRSELGVRFDHAALLDPTAMLTLRGRLAWAHDWVTDPSLVAVFQALPGASFTVNGAAPAKDSALASAGAELRLANGVTLLGKLDSEFTSRSNTYAGTGTVRVNW